MRIAPSAFKNRGVSLVELLVSMVIALLVLAGVVNSFMASRTSFRFNEELAFIQENARYATEYLSREIRGAGYMGCDQSNSITVNSVDDAGDSFIDTRGIQGFEGIVSTFPATFSTDVWGNTDAIIVRQGDQDNSFTVESHSPSSADIQIVGSHNFDPGTIFMISDANCRHQGIFVMTGPSSAGPDNHIVHNSGGGLSPGNCTRSIMGDGAGDTSGNGVFDCDDGCAGPTCDWSDASGAYGPDSTVMAMSSKAFYIGPSSADNTMPALQVCSLSNTGSTSCEELVPGIEDFQLTYGVDTDADGQPNQYYTADAVAVANWGNVVAVRIQMVMRSRNAALEEAESRTLLGVTYTDRFLRQLITTTVRVRNYMG